MRTSLDPIVPPSHLPPSRAATAAQADTSFGRGPLLLGTICWLAYTLLGVWVVSTFGMIGDALARIANATYVLSSRDPHLAAIGFVWMPLQSLLAMPLVLLKPVWPALVEQGAAANLISAVFGGIGAYYFVRLLHRMRLPPWVRWTATLLYVLNPAIVYYAANGMTELIMLAAMLAIVDALWGYLEDGNLWDLQVAGLWAGLGFLARYEMVFWAGVMVATLGFALARLARYHRRLGQTTSSWTSAVLVLWLMPLVCLITIWIFLNWSIMGNPLHFAQSDYIDVVNTGTSTSGMAVSGDSPPAGAALPDPDTNQDIVATTSYASAATVPAEGNIAFSAIFIAYHTVLFPPVIIGLVGLLVFGFSGNQRQHVRALILVAAAIGVPLMQLLMVYRGISSGWLRFFLSFIPFGFLSLLYGNQLVAARRGGRRVWAIGLAMLLAGNLISYQQTMTPLRERATASRFADAGSVWGYVRALWMSPLHAEQFGDFDASSLDVADYLDAHPELQVIVDSYRGFPVVTNVENPKRLVITSDRDFLAILNAPLGQVDAILVPKQAEDAINRRYPELRQGQAPWATLIKEFPGAYAWRLYAVHGQPGAPESQNP